MLDYILSIIENTYYMIFLENEKPKKINLNTKNYTLAKERAKKYKNEYIEIYKMNNFTKIY